MNLDEARRDLADAVAKAAPSRGRDVALRAARRVVVTHCLAALEAAPPEPQTLPATIRLAAGTSSRAAQRACAALVVHALAVPGLIPPAAARDVCALAEGGLRDVLTRCGYPAGAPTEEKLRVLERLHVRLDELMQPLEPTFPSWIQGLHAG